MLLHESRRAARTSPTGELDPAERPGPIAVEPRSDRGGVGAGGARARVAALRPLRDPGGDRGGARQRGQRRRHRLERDRRALRRPAARRSVAGRRAEPRGGGGDARRPRGRSGADRRDSCARRSAGLPPRARGAGGHVPPAGQDGASPRRLRARTRARRGRSRSGGFCNGGWPSCPTENTSIEFDPASPVRHRRRVDFALTRSTRE